MRSKKTLNHTRTAKKLFVRAASEDGVVRVKFAKGVRLLRSQKGFTLEYLLQTFEPEMNIWVRSDQVAEDVKSDYEAKWWQCCRTGNAFEIAEMLKGGGQALACARDANDRSGLHYASGLGSQECVRALLAYGAEVDAKDKDCFTPLHIAAGYLHEDIVSTLVKAGANPELQDISGRSPLDLIEGLLLSTPATTVTYARRSIMESITRTLEDFVFEEVPPAIIQACRLKNEQKEYLIGWLDEMPPSWVSEKDISDEVIEDFEMGLEYAEILKKYDPPCPADESISKRRQLVKVFFTNSFFLRTTN